MIVSLYFDRDFLINCRDQPSSVLVMVVGVVARSLDARRVHVINSSVPPMVVGSAVPWMDVVNPLWVDP